MSENECTPRTWPQNAWPTASELADWLSRCTSDERLSYADHSIATAQRAASCVDGNHAALLAEVSELRATVARVEALRETWKADDEDHLNRFGQHLMGGSVLSCAEHLTAALAALTTTTQKDQP